jgi:Zn-finger nucleic acid-binding protein
MDASGLHCPNCGAAVDFEARRCPYCQARLATVSCPQCFALMFDGAAFCPHCGHKRARADAQPADARCPGCKSGLHELTIGTTHVFECTSCDGVWVAADVFEKLCADRESRTALLPRLSPRKPQAAGSALAPVRYRPCVRCGKMMNRVNFGSISGAVIDVCKGHGTFLDAGELHQIVTFIQGGGLDRARERQREDLREEERKLRALERNVARREGGGPTHPVSWSAEDGIASGVITLIDMLGDIADLK